jgi:hypothetical protein
MNKEEIIAQVANDVLNSMNISQILNVLRSYSVETANDYVDGLDEEGIKDLEEKIQAAKAEIDKNREGSNLEIKAGT